MATRKPRQMELLKQAPKIFGGSRLKSNPKTGRTLSTKQPIHLILKSSFATGTYSFLQKHHQAKIQSLVHTHASKWKIKIFHFVNVGNHLHLVIQLTERKSFAPFIRALSGLIARQVLGAQRGAKKLVRNAKDFDALATQQGLVDFKSLLDRFWDARPFTRIVNWGRDFQNLAGYMNKNINQAGTRTHSLRQRGSGSNSDQTTSHAKVHASGAANSKKLVALGFDVFDPQLIMRFGSS